MMKYVLVGVGGRSKMFTEAFADTFKGEAELAAICDSNPGRLEVAAGELRGAFPELKTYAAEQFEAMVKTHEPDGVIVTTIDATHDDYICRAMRMGCDVITEKPMTTDERKCQRIIDTVKETGRKVRVTFNYRYAPPRSQVKQLLMENVVGKILSVEFQWLLDTTHGADYFRRWHSDKANSGGLMVHKATHHFDLINWWTASRPDIVYAMGGRVFYNTEQARRYGLENHAGRCLECPEKGHCNYYLDMTAYEEIDELYLRNEKYDGYLRDKCVFRNEINIEDTMHLTVKYNTGIYMSYSLNAFSPWEGYRVAFNGTRGRLEQTCLESTYISGDGSPQHAYQPEESSLVVYPHFRQPYVVAVEEGQGSHGGGDIVMLEEIFRGAGDDPLRRSADYVQGAYSILTGIAANKSMASGRAVHVNELVSGLPEPAYAKSSADDEAIPFVPEVSRLVGGVSMNANVPLKPDAPE